MEFHGIPWNLINFIFKEIIFLNTVFGIWLMIRCYLAKISQKRYKLHWFQYRNSYFEHPSVSENGTRSAKMACCLWHCWPLGVGLGSSTHSPHKWSVSFGVVLDVSLNNSLKNNIQVTGDLKHHCADVRALLCAYGNVFLYVYRDIFNFDLNRIPHRETNRCNYIYIAIKLQITRFMGAILAPPGSCWPQVGPMLAP